MLTTELQYQGSVAIKKEQRDHNGQNREPIKKEAQKQKQRNLTKNQGKYCQKVDAEITGYHMQNIQPKWRFYILSRKLI